MQVETYLIEDASSEASAMANDAAALELIERLGLSGQQKIANTETITRNPFRVMEAREMAVYKAICDKDDLLEKYAADAIPLRVLEVAAKAKDCGMFQQLRVWYPSEARIDDPVLVGVVKKYPYPDHPEKWMRDITSDVFYILARWGKTLLPFEKMEEQAIRMCRARRISGLKKAISEAQAALASAQDSIDIGELAKEVSLSH